MHKTFAMPHGGGGPGVGPICVAEHLRKFLPSHSIVPTGGDEGITAVASAPWGSAMLFPITYGYIKMLGGEGLKAATEMAIVNANYITLPLGKPFIGACIGGACGGAVQAQFMVGAATLGISGLPLAAATDQIPVYLLGLVMAYIGGFIATWLIGFDDPPEES